MMCRQRMSNRANPKVTPAPEYPRSPTGGSTLRVRLMSTSLHNTLFLATYGRLAASDDGKPRCVERIPGCEMANLTNPQWPPKR